MYVHIYVAIVYYQLILQERRRQKASTPKIFSNHRISNTAYKKLLEMLFSSRHAKERR